MTDHPISPPPELVEQWRREPEYAYDTQPKTMVTMTTDRLMLLSKKSAQYGADQELEACLRLVEIDAGEDAYDFARYIRAARRPEPLSLKEQALAILDDCSDCLDGSHENTIRRALEALPND